jgi:endonuclease/exonuclease/phosphatase family metal-dependent hydrolase
MLLELLDRSDEIHGSQSKIKRMDNQDQTPAIAAKLACTTFLDRASEPLHREFIRLVHWNIEKGKRWALLSQCLTHPAIASADIITLNEADWGMARSGNRHVAFEIAERLGMRAVFAPAFYEFTKGIGDELAVAGENTDAVQGNALLTRFPVVDYQNLYLPACHDAGHAAEKRAGGRAVLVVRLSNSRGLDFTVAVTHLEVLTTRRCRARQMKFILQHLPAGPAVVAGDLNSNAFDRGSFVHTLVSLLRLLRPSVQSQVMRPWDYEPLFREMKSAGFTWDQFNDRRATCRADLASLEDRKHVPAFLTARLLKRGRYLPLRLDWIACRGFKAAQPGQTITGLPSEPSDHLPVTCDLLPVSGNGSRP